VDDSGGGAAAAAEDCCAVAAGMGRFAEVAEPAALAAVEVTADGTPEAWTALPAPAGLLGAGALEAAAAVASAPSVIAFAFLLPPGAGAEAGPSSISESPSLPSSSPSSSPPATFSTGLDL
jgi:hypothetical protein